MRLSDADALPQNGCRSLVRFGDIHIASIPLSQLPSLAADSRVQRIEASPCSRALCDSMAIHLNATDAYTAQSGLPQAYTGQGVVMGVMDIGFDLTHPTFFSADTTRHRICRLWDQLATDTVGSTLPVGRDYTTHDELLALGHSRDGLDFSHGTHTLGIAAGSGFNSPYRGMAPDADICLVANAVTDDMAYVDPADAYKYTSATDALGFKYIFDYARSVGKPCVISFSEGSPQGFHESDLLYYAVLDSLTGPGRIIVASAGNDGSKFNWVHKPAGLQSAGTFLRSADTTMTVVARADRDFQLRIVAYGTEERRDTLLLSYAAVAASPDSTLCTALEKPWLQPLTVEALAYPSCYADASPCLDLTLSTSSGPLGLRPRVSVELLGLEADAELWRANGLFTTYAENPLLADARPEHYIHTPSTAPSVISVGATTCRDHIVNLSGDSMSYWPGSDGLLAAFSSMGPTLDGRTKPDCVAPGNNIISSFSSFYMEQHPTASDLDWNVETFPFRGRTYAWTSSSGTSMSAPAVGGAVALWLQACPTLSPADVLDVLQHTCRQPDPALAYPNNRYGYGLIDVTAGLCYILGLPTPDAINDIDLEPATPAATGAANDRAVFDLQGRRLNHSRWPPAKGVYISRGRKYISR